MKTEEPGKKKQIIRYKILYTTISTGITNTQYSPDTTIYIWQVAGTYQGKYQVSTEYVSVTYQIYIS